MGIAHRRMNIDSIANTAVQARWLLFVVAFALWYVWT